MALVALLSACQGSDAPVVVPPDLVGLWKTDHPRYEDRYFELTVDKITLGMGSGDTGSFPIREIGRERAGRTTLYSVGYANAVEGVRDTLSFYYEPQDGGAIRFRNQQNILWKRARAHADQRAGVGGRL
jgi:hypothetical protein